MSKRDKNFWAGLSGAARKALAARDYKAGSLAERLARVGVDAGELAAADRHKPEIKSIWIPGASCVSLSMATIIAALTTLASWFHPAPRTPFAWKVRKM